MKTEYWTAEHVGDSPDAPEFAARLNEATDTLIDEGMTLEEAAGFLWNDGDFIAKLEEVEARAR